MIGCNGCANTWWGERTAHCATCDLTFTTITAFDMHRRGGQCITPEAAKLTLVNRSYPCYGQRYGPAE